MKKFLAQVATQKCEKLQQEFNRLWWDEKPEGMGTAQARWNNRPEFEKLAEKLHFYSASLEKLGAIDKGDVLDHADLRDPANGYEKFQLMQARIGVLPWSEPLKELDKVIRDPEAAISKDSDSPSMG